MFNIPNLGAHVYKKINLDTINLLYLENLKDSYENFSELLKKTEKDNIDTICLITAGSFHVLLAGLSVPIDIANLGREILGKN